MLNLNKFCSLFIGLILSVVCALPLSARDINVRGTVTNIEGEPLFQLISIMPEPIKSARRMKMENIW